MSYLFFKNPKIEISYSKHYSFAVFGMNHAAFFGNDHIYYLPVEDKESIEASLNFYYDFVMNDAVFPVFDGASFSYVKSDDKRVIGQILGLPDELFSSLDRSKDILSQLHFANDLKRLKKTVYQEQYRSLERKYFCDDFRRYCLTKGIFFPYEETKPFVLDDHSLFPVYIDEKHLPKNLKALIEEGNSERFLIDFFSFHYDDAFARNRKAFDSYSFRRRVSYFVNGKFDSELSDLNKEESFRKNYALVLRRYLASIINYLYDQYCFEVLNKVTTKVSYLTPCKVFGKEGNLYAISSFNGERYTKDFKNYFFDKKDYDLIYSLRKKEYYLGESLLSLYAKLGLPYQGYRFLKEKKAQSVDDILTLLPFRERKTEESNYLSVKRFDLFYSYLPEEKEHRYVFSYRRLLKNGVFCYASKPLFEYSPDNQITIVIDDKVNRENTSLGFLDKKDEKLSSWPLSSYLIARERTHDSLLKEKLVQMDERSNNSALYEFYRLFHQTTLRQALSILSAEYGLSLALDEKRKDFFFYLLSYPFLAVEPLFRNEARENKDITSLRQLDGKPDAKDRYEPNLPYPYVSYGKLCYSFRKTRFGKAYLCSCSRKAVENRIDYLLKTIKPNSVEKYSKRISQIGLPDNIISQLNPFNPDLKSQIPYKDGLCHLCNSSTPSYYECRDEKTDALYNIYFTYIRAKASEHGVYWIPTLNEDFDKYEDFPLKMFHLDKNKIEPILKPYIQKDRKSIISLLSSFFGPDFFYSSNFGAFSAFRSRPEDLGRNQNLLSLLGGLSTIGPVVLRLFYTYAKRAMAYGVERSSSFLSSDETPFARNIDYNPKLPHPYVFLGRHYNAYADDAFGKNLAFCLCEKETRRKERKYSLKRFDFSVIPAEFRASVLLGLVGLPYSVVLSLQDVDLSLTSVDELLERIPFKESICRRCLNITHCAYLDVFTKALPLKENSRAEYTFAVNGRLRDGFAFVTSNPISYLVYQKDHHYDLSSDYDPLLPCLNRLDDSVPEAVFSFFVPGEDKLKDYLYDYQKKALGNAEISAYASGIILDTYKRDNKCILKFINSISETNYRDNLITCFPDVSNIRSEIQENVFQSRIGFFTFLYEKLVLKYVEKEKRIGR